MSVRRPHTRRRARVDRPTRDAPTSAGAARSTGKNESRAHHPAHVRRIWLRRALIVLPAALIIAGVYTQWSRAVNRDNSVPPKPADAARLQPPASAQAAPSSKPAQPTDLPQPTVVLKPGEVPGIAFKEPTHDFGRVRSGTDVTHDFEFTNTGTGPLEILQVKPG